MGYRGARMIGNLYNELIIKRENMCACRMPGAEHGLNSWMTKQTHAPLRHEDFQSDDHDSWKCEVHSAWSFRVHATIRSVAVENHWRSRFNRFNCVSRSRRLRLPRWMLAVSCPISLRRSGASTSRLSSWFFGMSIFAMSGAS